jgi:hypothetical protein
MRLKRSDECLSDTITPSSPVRTAGAHVSATSAGKPHPERLERCRLFQCFASVIMEESTGCPCRFFGFLKPLGGGGNSWNFLDDHRSKTMECQSVAIRCRGCRKQREGPRRRPVRPNQPSGHVMLRAVCWNCGAAPLTCLLTAKAAAGVMCFKKESPCQNRGSASVILRLCRYLVVLHKPEFVPCVTGWTS